MSVYKRGGIYWYDFWFRGYRIRESTGFTNKTVALRAEAIRKAEFAEGRAGIVQCKPCPTFEGFVTAEFFPWSESEHQAHPRTHQRYRVSAKPLIASFGRLPLGAISPGHVERFKVSRSRRVSPATVNRDLAALRYILNFALRHDHIVRNPVTGVRFLPEGPSMMRVVSPEEQERYLAAANPLLRDVATLMVETGLRPGEVFAIRSEDVHLTSRYLFVPGGKTQFARRSLPLTDPALRVLERRLERARGDYLFWHKSDPNRPLTTVQKAHENAVTEAEFRIPFRLYDLRHTYGSRAAMAGVDLATLKELMGHSHISVTMKYVHSTPEHKRRAVAKLARFNAEQAVSQHEKLSGSPQKSPHYAGQGREPGCNLLKMKVRRDG